MTVTKAVFAARLRMSIERSGHTQMSLAKALDIPRATLVSWCTARTMPVDGWVIRLAVILDDDHLPWLVREARERSCQFCERRFDATLKTRTRRFCSTPCRSRWWQLRRASDARMIRYDDIKYLRLEIERVRLELREYDDVVKRMCWECEWDGVCKVPKCPLRAKSPHPLRKDLIEER